MAEEEFFLKDSRKQVEAWNTQLYICIYNYVGENPAKTFWASL